MNDIRKISHVLKHSHWRCVFGPFDKILHEGYIWTGHIDVLSFILHKLIFIHFVHYDTRFYDKYIISDDRKKYIDDYRSSVSTKQKARNIYNVKYQRTYSNWYYVLKNNYIKYIRKGLTYSGRKQRAIGMFI